MRCTWMVALALAACSKDSSTTGPAARDALISAWKQGGLDPSKFTPATTTIGKDCASGTIDKIDVMVCTFASADDAKKAEDAGLNWVGNTTGAARAKGALLIAVADRHKADREGRTINKIYKLAPN